MDEISENLKRTIKKYNEIDQENDLSVIDSVENEEISNKSNLKDIQQSKKFENENSEKNNIVNTTKKVFDHNLNFNYNSNTSNPQYRDYPNFNTLSKNLSDGNDFNTISKPVSSNNQNFQMDYSPTRNFKKANPGVNSKAQKVLDNLDLFNNSINKDFREVEDMIENMIEKELKNFYK
jgi:hypothetical protein